MIMSSFWTPPQTVIQKLRQLSQKAPKKSLHSPTIPTSTIQVKKNIEVHAQISKQIHQSKYSDENTPIIANVEGKEHNSATMLQKTQNMKQSANMRNKNYVKNKTSRKSFSILCYQGPIPPAPAQIYHEINRSPNLNENKPNTRDYHIRMNIDIKKYKGRAVNVGKNFKKNHRGSQKSRPFSVIPPTKNFQNRYHPTQNRACAN